MVCVVYVVGSLGFKHSTTRCGPQHMSAHTVALHCIASLLIFNVVASKLLLTMLHLRSVFYSKLNDQAMSVALHCIASRSGIFIAFGPPAAPRLHVYSGLFNTHSPRQERACAPVNSTNAKPLEMFLRAKPDASAASIASSSKSPLLASP